MILPYGRDYTCEHGEPWGQCCAATPLEQLRAALLETADLDRLPVPSPVVRDIFYADSLAWLQGKPGHGKSFIALDIAGCVATGETWHGRPVQRGRVLYLIAEGVTGLAPRVRAWESAMGAPMGGVSFLPVAVQSANATAWRALVELAAELQPGLVVIDTQARVTVGRDENSAQDMGEFVDAAERLRRAAGACVLIVHHQGRNGEHMRGSTALEGAATTIVRTEKEAEVVAVSCVKQKDAAEFDRFFLRMVPTAESVVMAPGDGRIGGLDPPKWLETWWALHGDEWISISTLTTSGVTSAATFHRHKLDLLNRHLMDKKGEGSALRFKLTRDQTLN